MIITIIIINDNNIIINKTNNGNLSFLSIIFF